MMLGIDEAGRGPVLGPLVVGGYATEDDAWLVELGVADSKKLTPAKRERLERLLKDDPRGTWALEVIPAEEIDQRMAHKTLNLVEVDAFRAIMAKLPATHVFADAADVDAQRFGHRLAEGFDAEVTAEHKADDRHPVVAAASILAKVERDRQIQTLRRELEQKLPYALGSGYPSDDRTKRFLKAWYETFQDLPPGTRRGWATSKRILEQGQQRRLDV